jgi:8-oxo-dGTP pyrophosphatase MutT (NUDIX family)
MLAHLQAWDGIAAEPRDAATAVILRSGEHGREVFLMRRRSSMAFAAGMFVFPGGGVQPSDYDDVAWIGPPPSTWGGRFHCAPALAAALVVTAVRETFEETGILFAGADEKSVVGEVAGTELEDARQAVEAKARSFGDLLADHGLSLRADLLGAWAHWITPEFEPRRFDTRFFVATLPAHQAVGGLSAEADAGLWIPLADAYDSASAGKIQTLPPTLHTLSELATLGDVDVLEAARERQIKTIQPVIVEDDGTYFIERDESDSV